MRDVAVSADGLRINYDVQGEGEPALVFVHGWSCDRTYWQGQVSHFASRYTVVAIDLGGHGDSGLEREAWTMAAYGEDVVAVVEKLGLAQVVLIGHSMGGTVIVEAAQRMPARVIGIVGVDTFKSLMKTFGQSEIDTEMSGFRADFVQTTDKFVRSNMFVPASNAALVDKIAADMSSAPPQVAISAAEHLFAHGEERRLGLQALQAPAALINSDHSPTDVEAAGRFGISVEMMSGTGHFVMIEDTDTFNRILEDVVQGIVARV